MESELGNIELFDRYLNNQMPEDERLVFESRLAIDSSFREDYTTYCKVEGSLKKLGAEHRLKQQLINADRARKASANKLKALRWVSISAAASILLAIGLFVGLSKSGEERLFAKYYVKDAGLPVYLGEGQDKALADAMSQFKAANYNDALKEFEQLNSDTAKFYSALCLIELNEQGKAKTLLGSLQESKSNFIAQKSQYYLLLLSIRDGNSVEAKVLFNKLYSLPSFIYKDELERLKNDEDFILLISQ